MTGLVRLKGSIMAARITYFLLFLLTTTVSAYPETWNTLQFPPCFQFAKEKQAEVVSTTQIVSEHGVGIALEVVGDSYSNFSLSDYCRNHVNYIQPHCFIEGKKIRCTCFRRFCDRNNTWIERKSKENLWTLMPTNLIKNDDGLETYGSKNESDLKTYPNILNYDDGPATVSPANSRLFTNDMLVIILLFVRRCLAKILTSSLRYMPTRNVQNTININSERIQINVDRSSVHF